MADADVVDRHSIHSSAGAGSDAISGDRGNDLFIVGGAVPDTLGNPPSDRHDALLATGSVRRALASELPSYYHLPSTTLSDLRGSSHSCRRKRSMPKAAI